MSHSAVSQQSGRNQWAGQNSEGKKSWTRLSLIDDEIVINLQRTSLCLLGFCVVPRKGSSTSRIQRSLEEQGCRNPIREKLQRL